MLKANLFDKTTAHGDVLLLFGAIIIIIIIKSGF